MATSYDTYVCAECGADFYLDGSGVALHLDEDGDRDYDADGDHSPYSRESRDG